MRQYKRVISLVLLVIFLTTQVFNSNDVMAKTKDKNNKDKDIITTSLNVTTSTESIVPTTIDSGTSKTDIIVKYKDENKNAQTLTNIRGKFKNKKLKEKGNFKKLRMNVLEIDATDDMSKVIAELKKDPNVLYAQPNYSIGINTITDDYGNSVETAYELNSIGASKKTTNGSFEEINDVDYFKFSVLNSGTYKINTTGQIDTMGRLYDENIIPVCEERDDDENRNFIIKANLISGKTYYIRVRGYSDDKGFSEVVGAYGLEIQSIDPMADEYGNDIATAHQLGMIKSTGTTINGALQVPLEYDFIKFTAPINGEYTIKTLGNSDTMGIIYDENNNPLCTEHDDDDALKNFVIKQNLEANKSYFIRIRGWSDTETGEHSEGPYTLSITPSPKVYSSVIGTWANSKQIYATNISQCKAGDHIITPGGGKSIIDHVGGNYLFLTSDVKSWYGGQALVYVQPSKDNSENQWYLDNIGQEVEGKTGRTNVDINAINAWNLTKGSSDVVVGVLDSGIDINHVDLKNNIFVNENEIPGNGLDDDHNGYIDDVYGWDFSNDDSTVFDSPETDLHGTYTAGVIAASMNDMGITGVAPNVKVLPLKFISGSKGYTCDALEAIEYAKNMGISIINCSFGGTDNNQALKEAMQNSGILFVCAAGNRGGDSATVPVYPASFDIDNVLSVASVDGMGILSSFSNRGTGVDTAAPGAIILSTIPGNSYDYFSGTSASSAIVSGIAALVKSYTPSLSILDIKNKIINNSTHCTALESKVISNGRVDAFAAISGMVQDTDTYNGQGAGDVVLVNSMIGSPDTWYTLDQLSKVKERLHYGESGVNPASGNFSMTCTDMSVPAPGFQVNISRTYNAKDDKETLLGRGWTFGFEAKSSGTDLVEITLPDGSAHRFRLNGSVYTPEDTRATYTRDSNGVGTLTTKDQYQYCFDATGKMTWMQDKNGNKLSVTYLANGKIDFITDTVGRQYKLTYNASGFIATVTDPDNRVVIYNYENSLLKSVKDPNGGITTYGYDASKYLTTMTDASGKWIQTLEYSRVAGDSLNKVKKTIDSYGDTWNYNYDMTNNNTTITNTDNRKWTYWFDLSMYTIKVQDPEGKSELTEYYLTNGRNVYGDVKTKTDKNGNKTVFEIDNMGNVTKITNPDGGIKRTEYDSKNNVKSETDELGHKSFNIYNASGSAIEYKVEPLNGTDIYVKGVSVDANFAITKYEYYTKAEAQSMFACNVEGLLKSVTDPTGIKTTYTYDQYGNQKETVDAVGNKTTSTYNNVGWKLTETTASSTAAINVYKWDYDKNGSIIRATNPDGGVTRTCYNLAGAKTLEVNPEQYEAAKDNLISNVYTGTKGTSYEYYDNGLLRWVLDELGFKTEYFYDKYGNLETEKKPNGSIYRYTYDVMNRPSGVYYKATTATEVQLFSTTYESLADGRSQTTSKTYLSTTDVATTITVTDYAGRTVEVQNADGTKTKTSYNLDGSVATTTAANGAITTYVYDAMGNLSDVWSPNSIVNGTTKYSWTHTTYDNAGKKEIEMTGKDLVDLNTTTSNVYTKTNVYNSLGQLDTFTDSEGRKTIYKYDAEGNMNKETHYSTSTEFQTTDYTYTYFKKPASITTHVRKGDLAGNDYIDNTLVDLTTSFVYDKNGNLKNQTEPDGDVTSFDYDVLNRQVKVTKQSLNENNQLVTAVTSKEYTWDSKVLKSTDALGNVTDFGYDERGNLTKLTNALGKSAYMYYDRAGRKITEVTPNNYIAGYTLANMEHTEYTYDIMSRLLTKSQVYKKMTLDGSRNWVTNNITTVAIEAYAYDNMGNTVKTLNALGYQAGTGTTVAEKIRTGYGTKSSYNLAGALESTLDPESAEKGLSYAVKYTYNGLGFKTNESYSDGTSVLYTYDGTGNLKNTYVNGKLQSSTEYDLLGKAIQSTDALGHVTTSTWNALGKVAKVITPGDGTIASNTTLYQYDKTANLLYSKDSLGKITTITLDPDNHVLSQTIKNAAKPAESITTSARYDINGNKRSETDGMGFVTSYIVDNLNRVTTVSKTVGGKLKTSSCEYDDNNNKKTETNYLGNIISYRYDGMNRLIETKDPTGQVISQIIYNDASAQTINYDAFGHTTIYDYDKNLREISRTDGENHKTSQAYDKRGNISTKVDGMGYVTTFTYDEFGKLKTVVNAVGETTSYNYDANGNMLTQTNAKGQTTTFEYNVANKKTKTMDPNGVGNNSKTESYTYYADGSLQNKTDRNGVVTSYKYDIFGRLEEENAGGTMKSYTYDSNSNQLTMTDATGTTVRGYDDEGRVTTKNVPSIGLSTYAYDVPTAAGISLEQTTDPKGNVTQKSYDKAGRLQYVISEGKTTKYAYYDNGNRQSVTYPDGSTETYTYYKDNNIETLTNRKANGTVLETYTYTYNAAEKQTSKVDAKGITSYDYDSLGRLSTVTEPSSKITSYTYDKAGNRLTESVTANMVTQTTKYDYNDQNRLTKTTQSAQSNTLITNYVYDNNGNLKSKSKTGLTSTPPTPTNGTGFEFPSFEILFATNGVTYEPSDSTLDVTTIANWKSGCYSLANGVYTPDAARICLLDYLPCESNKEYQVVTSDSRYQVLIREMTSNIRMIKSNNLTNGQKFTPTAETKYLAISLYSPTGAAISFSDYQALFASGYTVNVSRVLAPGEVIGKVSTKSSKDVALYSYDNYNRLTKLVEGDTTSLYGYNAQDYRTEKTVKGVTTKYLYEGDKVVLEVDNAGNQTGRNVYGTNLLMRQAGADKFYYMYNGHADVTALMDSNGNVAQTYYYDAFGNVLEKTGSINNNITYAGYQFDQESGLYYLNARYYDSKIARFITEDTYRGQANDPLSLNLYAYCSYDPIRYTDPSGHMFVNEDIVGSGKNVSDKANAKKILDQQRADQAKRAAAADAEKKKHDAEIAEQLRLKQQEADRQKKQHDAEELAKKNKKGIQIPEPIKPFLSFGKGFLDGLTEIPAPIVEGVITTINKPIDPTPGSYRPVTSYEDIKKETNNFVEAVKNYDIKEDFKQGITFINNNYINADINTVAYNLAHSTVFIGSFFVGAKGLKVATTTSEVSTEFKLVDELIEGTVNATESISGVVQSRINIASGKTRFTPLRPSTGQPVSAGWEHVVDGHFDVPLSNSRSVFTASQSEIKTILQSPTVVKSPVTVIEGGQYVRTVNTGEVVGNTALKFGGNETTWIQVYTDKAGNLITTYPVPAPK